MLCLSHLRVLRPLAGTSCVFNPTLCIGPSSLVYIRREMLKQEATSEGHGLHVQSVTCPHDHCLGISPAFNHYSLIPASDLQAPY